VAEPVPAGKLADYPEGAILARNVNGRSVAVVRVGGRVHAYANYCPHAGFTLSGGFASSEALVCDVHGAVFDLVTGKALAGPASEGLEVYEVVVVDDNVFIGERRP
jgi:nitrite reductase/ring-hydroxylating ferredoxin subunit